MRQIILSGILLTGFVFWCGNSHAEDKRFASEAERKAAIKNALDGLKVDGVPLGTDHEQYFSAQSVFVRTTILDSENQFPLKRDEVEKLVCSTVDASLTSRKIKLQGCGESHDQSATKLQEHLMISVIIESASRKSYKQPISTPLYKVEVRTRRSSTTASFNSDFSTGNQFGVVPFNGDLVSFKSDLQMILDETVGEIGNYIRE